jgi:hypothetical protein
MRVDEDVLTFIDPRSERERPTVWVNSQVWTLKREPGDAQSIQNLVPKFAVHINSLSWNIFFLFFWKAVSVYSETGPAARRTTSPIGTLIIINVLPKSSLVSR